MTNTEFQEKLQSKQAESPRLLKSFILFDMLHEARLAGDTEYTQLVENEMDAEKNSPMKTILRECEDED